MIDDDQNTVSDSNQRFLLPHPLDQAMVLGRKICTPTVGGCPRSLYQSGPEKGAPLRRLPGLALARRFVIAWTESRPTSQMSRTGKARHLHSYLRDNRLCDLFAHAWNRVKQPHSVRNERVWALLDRLPDM